MYSIAYYIKVWIVLYKWIDCQKLKVICSQRIYIKAFYDDYILRFTLLLLENVFLTEIF